MADTVWITRNHHCPPDFTKRYRDLRVRISNASAEINFLQKWGKAYDNQLQCDVIGKIKELYVKYHMLKAELADQQNDLISLCVHEDEALYSYGFQMEGRRLWVQVQKQEKEEWEN